MSSFEDKSKFDLNEVRVLKRPDWWHPTHPASLPSIGAIPCYSGTGKLNSGGKVWSGMIKVR